MSDAGRRQTAETRPLVPVVERARMRSEGGADDVLECGHLVTFDGSRPVARRCPECPPTGSTLAPFTSPSLFDVTDDARSQS